MVEEYSYRPGDGLGWAGLRWAGLGSNNGIFFWLCERRGTTACGGGMNSYLINYTHHFVDRFALRPR
jgi:hypothetical protein